MFYVIENNDGNVWKKTLLFHCIQLCIKTMLKSVTNGVCPDSFIPSQNLFDGRLSEGCRLISENILEKLLNVGYDCFLHVQTNNICDYIRSRVSYAWYQLLQRNSKRCYIFDLYARRKAIMLHSITIFNERILGYDYNNTIKSICLFIKYLWNTLDRIHHSGTITEHTTEETRSSLSLLIPHIHTCLASNISSMAIKHPNAQIRDFLLYGSFKLYVNGDQTGRLKWISVLYAAGLYKECAWFFRPRGRGLYTV